MTDQSVCLDVLAVYVSVAFPASPVMLFCERASLHVDVPRGRRGSRLRSA